ncbi:MAG: LytTR family DNA-binding domain-containing protein [Akkermansiaceae bacterium]|nr:LytTR family DNA-binding domain-containing protein [Akkermansiaceae bacterium]
MQMPKKNGFALLPKLENLTPQPAVVFVTAYDEYAIRAFEANALDYLTKPVSSARLAKTILRLSKPPDAETGVPHPVAKAGERLEAADLVLLRNKSLSMMVKVEEIAAVEAHGDYTRILLSEGANLMMKQTLFHWENQLPTGLFAKVSRSLLVNTQSIGKLVKKNLHTWELQLQGTEEPIQLSNLESKRLRALL